MVVGVTGACSMSATWRTRLLPLSAMSIEPSGPMASPAGPWRSAASPTLLSPAYPPTPVGLPTTVDTIPVV